MTPRCSNRRTRWCTADTDSPTFSARSVYDRRPSAVRAATIARSISSTPEKYSGGCRVRRAPVRHAGEWTHRAATDQEIDHEVRDVAQRGRGGVRPGLARGVGHPPEGDLRLVREVGADRQD